MGGFGHFKLIIIEIFTPSSISFLPLYYVLYKKFIEEEIN
jgi:hypothetical protein